MPARLKFLQRCWQRFAMEALIELRKRSCIPYFWATPYVPRSKPWHIGYSNPSHNGNIVWIQISINGLMTIPQSVKIICFDHGTYLYSYKTRSSSITLQSQTWNPSFFSYPSKNLRNPSPPVSNHQPPVPQFRSPNASPGGDVGTGRGPTGPGAPTGTWADVPGPRPRRAQRCRWSNRSAIRRGTPAARPPIRRGCFSKRGENMERPEIYIYIYIYTIIYIYILWHWMRISMYLLYISPSICLSGSMFMSFPHWEWWFWPGLIAGGALEGCRPKIGFHLTIAEILVLPLFPPRSFSSNTAFKLLASL